MDDLTPYQRHALEKASERRNGFGIPVVVGSLGALYFYASGATLGALGAGLATFGYIQQKRKEADEITLAVRTGAPIPHLPELAGLLPPAPTTTQAQQTGVNVEVTNTPTFNPIYNPSITINTPETTPRPAAPVPMTVPAAPSRFTTTSGIPEEDPSHLIATCNHALIVAATDTGKTTTVKASIRRKFELHNGHCQFWISDPKGSTFLGLEQTQDYLFFDESNANGVAAMLDQAQAELRDRIARRRVSGLPTTDPYLTIILDEWMTTLILLNPNPKIREKACHTLDQILATGREDRVGVWVVTQSHLVKEIGISGMSRNNMATFALGRSLNISTVRRAVGDQYLSDLDPQTRTELQQKLKDYEGQEIPICFTTAGVARMMQVPDLRGYINWSYPLKTPKEPEPDFVIDLPPDPRNLSPEQELKVRSRIIKAIKANPEDKWGTIKDIFSLSKGGGDKQKAASAIYDDCLATLGV